MRIIETLKKLNENQIKAEQKLNEIQNEPENQVEQKHGPSFQEQAKINYDLTAKNKYLYDLTVNAVISMSKSMPQSKALDDILGIVNVSKENVVGKNNFTITDALKSNADSFDYEKIEQFFIDNAEKDLKNIEVELDKVVAPNVSNFNEINVGFDKDVISTVHNNIPDELKQDEQINNAIQFIDANYERPVVSFLFMETDIVENIDDLKNQKDAFTTYVPQEEGLKAVNSQSFAKFPHQEGAPLDNPNLIYGLENPETIQDVAFVEDVYALQNLRQHDLKFSNEYKAYIKDMFKAFDDMKLYPKSELMNDEKKYAFQNVIKAKDAIYYAYQDFPKQNYVEDGVSIHLTDEQYKQKLTEHYKKMPQLVDKYKTEVNNIEKLYKIMDSHEQKLGAGSVPKQFYMTNPKETGIQMIPMQLKQDYEKMARLNAMFSIYEFATDYNLKDNLDDFLDQPLQHLYAKTQETIPSFNAFFPDKNEFLNNIKEDAYMNYMMSEELGGEPTQKQINAWRENKYFENNLKKITDHISFMNFTKQKDILSRNVNDVVDALANLDADENTKEENKYIGNVAKKTYLTAAYKTSTFKATQYLSDSNIFQRLAIVNESDVPNYFEVMAPSSYNYLTLSQDEEPAFDTVDYLNDMKNETRFDLEKYKLTTLFKVANENLEENRKDSAFANIYEGVNKYCFFRQHDSVVYDANGQKGVDADYQDLQRFLNQPVEYLQEKGIDLKPEQANMMREIAQERNNYVSEKEQKAHELSLKQQLQVKEKAFNDKITAINNEIKLIQSGKLTTSSFIGDPNSNEINANQIPQGVDIKDQQILLAKANIASLSYEHAQSLKEDMLAGKISKSYFIKRMEQLKTLQPVKEKELPAFFEIDKFPKNAQTWFAQSQFKNEQLSNEEKQMLFVSAKEQAEMEKGLLLRNGAYFTLEGKANDFKVAIPSNILKLADESNFVKLFDKEPSVAQNNKDQVLNNVEKQNNGQFINEQLINDNQSIDNQIAYREKISISLNENKQNKKSQFIKSNEKELKLDEKKFINE